MACKASCDCKKCSIIKTKLKKGEQVKVDKKDFIKEHKKLVSILRSPSKKDDKKEAKDQAEELKEVTKKSLDFDNTKVAIETVDQIYAEKSASPVLVDIIKSGLGKDLNVVKLEKGTLTLSLKEPGLYNGFFQDLHGQIVEKFDNVTPEMVAKSLELKQYYQPPVIAPMPIAAPSISEAKSDLLDELKDREIARQEASRLIEEAQMKNIKSLSLRFGDFSLELRKSVHGFVNARKSQSSEQVIKKAIASWRKQHREIFPSESAAAKEISQNWQQHEQSFCQIVYGIQQLGKKDEA